MKNKLAVSSIDRQLKTHKIAINRQTDAAKHHYRIEQTDVYSPHELYETQHQFITYIIQCLNNNQNALIQSPTGTGKTISLLLSSLSWLAKYQQNNESKKNIRIIYTSRSHCQLKQAMSEAKKLPFKVNSCILSSRNNSCILQELSLLNDYDKQFECRLRILHKNNRTCKYYKVNFSDIQNEKYYSDLNTFQKIADLQQISLNGKIQSYCPYFYSRAALPHANIVFMPYNYLFDQKFILTAGNIIQDSIIIFDEAHNLQQVCEQSCEFQVKLTTLMKASRNLAGLYQQKARQAQQKQIKNETLKSSVQNISLHACYIEQIQANIQMFELPAYENGKLYTIKQFLQIMDRVTSKANFGSILTKIQMLYSSSKDLSIDIFYKPFQAVESWLNFVQFLWMFQKKQNQNGQNSVIQIFYEGSDFAIKFHCLDASIGFKKIMKYKPKCVILTSGTLSPLRLWPIQLKVSFANPVSCPHILSTGQVSTHIVCQGISHKNLTFSYQNRSNQQLYEDIGILLQNVVRSTANGVIVFFSSYAMLENTKNQLNALKMLSKIYELKNIYYEKKNSFDFKSVLDCYLRDAVTSKGAVLFALIRGKVSQGLDFADQKCRAVVLIGVPYPASKDVKVQSKIKYLDNIKKKSKQESISGNQWYLSETIRSINQAIGRIVRNKKDYGQIYLLDERFKRKQIMGQISSWAQQNIQISETYQQFVQKLKLVSDFRNKTHREKNQDCLISTNGLAIKQFQSAQGIKTIKGTISRSFSSQPVQSQKPVMSLQQMLAKFKSQKSIQKQLPDDYLRLEKLGCSSREQAIFKQKKQIIKQQTHSEKVQECPVCLQQKIMISNIACIHLLCMECWEKTLEQDLRCPICRARVRVKFLKPNGKSNQENDQY